TTLLAEKADPGNKTRKARTRKIDDRITIPKSQQTYRAVGIELQEHLYANRGQRAGCNTHRPRAVNLRSQFRESLTIQSIAPRINSQTFPTWVSVVSTLPSPRRTATRPCSFVRVRYVCPFAFNSSTSAPQASSE